MLGMDDTDYYECVCGHPRMSHLGGRSHCDGIVRFPTQWDEELCICDKFEDILDRPLDRPHHRVGTLTPDDYGLTDEDFDY
jgi:hypothetical protein